MGSRDFSPHTRDPTDSSDAETLFPGNDYETKRENLRTIHSQGQPRPFTGVDVKRAEEEFAELSKQLSGISERARHLTHQQSNRISVKSARDLEEPPADGEPFDLETALHGSRTAEADAGIRPKRIGVIWEGLSVRGIGGVKNVVRTFPNAVIDFFNIPQTIMQILGLGKKGKELEILKNFKGLAKPGEMILVLGKPSSGCTTFLKVIANQRFGYTGIDGEVLYGPFDANTFQKRFRGEAVYNQEDDVHHPTLTVGQTLGFALDTKTPGKRPVGVSKAEFKIKVIRLLLKMFNIEHTIDTVVGNQFIRGISGGERKRVSIAEMMITSATVLAWDNTTRGLDASTALDYAKSLRIMTNIYKTTTFVSLYQASENIYEQFDKVMVVDSGRQVYFGPIGEARAYFESLGFKEKPRQTTPDYLTGCTDPFEREYKEGRNEHNTPSTPDALVQAFEESYFNRLLEKDMEKYRAQLVEEKHVYDDFETAHLEAKRKYTSKSSVYSIPFYIQVWVLMRRQFFIKWQDKFSLAVSWITSIGVALVLGTVWLQLPKTSAGAFTRGGVLFISLLFNALQAFGELAATMMGRQIVNKHRAFTFHRPSALWIAQIGVDLTFASVQIFIFSVIVYFMCGLALDAGAFFTFILIIITGYLSMTLFFRTVGCVCPDFDYALKGISVLITLFVVTSGYLIQWRDQQVWLRWFFYVNAVGLGFSSLMINEFKRLTMKCTADSLIPAGPGYTNVSHQVCTLPGGEPGSSIIPGSNYLSLHFQYYPSDLWRNWGIMVILIIGFLCANTYLGETLMYGAGGKTVTFFARETDELKKLNQKLQQRKQNRQQTKSDESESPLKIESKSVLSWENLCYDVPVPSGTRRLLSDVFGYVEPGKLTALMGASGAGKTTLLDVLASRKNIGVITGDILVDGRMPGSAFQRGTSYAEQLDVHEPMQTVREAFRFSATLRQSYEIPEEAKFAYVEEIISLLELENLADAIIGTPETGLSVEERKRVTIGVELAAKPQLLLFLDEPTSGLDSQSAFNIVRFLRKLAAAGQAILCTIHQPNSALFENFDRLLLLQRGGQCVYFGDIGEDARVLRDYFHRNGADCPQNANPAEWMLDAIGAGQAPRIGSRDWGDVWTTSPELQQLKQTILAIKTERIQENDASSTPQGTEAEYATPLWHQIKVVCKRTNLAFWRSPNYGFTRLFNHVALALITGLCFLQLDESRSSLQNRIFVLFQITVIPALILAQVEPKYDMSRLIFYRESAAKAYKQFPFALSMVLAEIPYSILCAVCFFLPIYYVPGLQSASSRAGYQFLMVLITEIFSVTLGQMISALTPSTFIAVLLNPPIIIIFFLFCGVSIPKPQIPKFWRVWLYELDPFTRLMSGMIVTELHERQVTCKPEELNRFTPPPGQDCGSYMKNFFANGGSGYLIKNTTDACEFCAYKIGDQFYKPFGMNFDNRWRDLGIFLCFIVLNLILLFIGSRYLNFNRR
ncbi:ATP-binding cassette transporter snq2 [Ophidiomyces ophidiicola]|uniref:ATP-binding cassette transporter snq2 n=1 Tax=Ophidiomyces ophidiicola TaxID=1387563 RepID=A0ACB8V3M7_9EURO|nr:ATP-binding cassette transporter snq2 [Ophidiomyces ophidiicola]KAI1970163.1 ATP-binding cassette transporter snq2 [Ophidiomyces ophidiicola]KAI2004594.1 ATP-binding cassette transporter snq2 [Ophidiomyces ophidiicola]KAI2023816.1 ATP-binding cassette transporter snq2 [Ophidiomyces ophidiicola]KAI2038637.1 ATP-binding cassette transporter snq2 [Ophidiomyces ophidiicola]